MRTRVDSPLSTLCMCEAVDCALAPMLMKMKVENRSQRKSGMVIHSLTPRTGVGFPGLPMAPSDDRMTESTMNILTINPLTPCFSGLYSAISILLLGFLFLSQVLGIAHVQSMSNNDSNQFRCAL